MEFNKSLDWLKESDEDDDLLADDELDSVEEEMNEGLYVDPSNYDKHDDLVDVVDKQGNAQKMTQDTYNKNKDSGEFEKKEPEEKDKDAAISKQRVIQNVPNIREGLKMLERDAELSKNYSDFGPSNDMNSGNYIAKNNETGRYEVVGHYNTDNTVTVFANNKKEEPKEKEQDKEVDKEQSVDSFEDIPDRNEVNWLNVPTIDAKSYDNTVTQLFNVDKRPDANHAENLMRTQIFNGLDGELVKEIKDRLSQMQLNDNKELIQTVKSLDDYAKAKQFDKAGNMYLKLWDIIHA